MSKQIKIIPRPGLQKPSVLQQKVGKAVKGVASQPRIPRGKFSKTGILNGLPQ